MTDIDPDQLLQTLDASILAARSKRAASSGTNRTTIRAAGLLIIVIGTVVVLFGMEYVATEMVPQRPASQNPPSQITEK